MKTIEIVTSAFNEEACLPELFTRLNAVFSSETAYKFHILITDNGSTDRTWEIISDEAKSRGNVTGFRMARNFSLDSALTNGIDNASADAVVIMTSDLQDPPETIPALLRRLEEGYEQVIVKVTSRKSVPLIRRLLTKSFYFIANKLSSGLIPESVSDFRLISRNTYQAIRTLRESHRFLRGLGAWVGFRTCEVEIERPERFGGKSSWLGIALPKVVGQSTKNILAFSGKPLAWVSVFGIVMSLGSIILVSFLSIFWIIRGVPFPGFGSLIGLFFVGFSLIMLCIGVLAQYLGLIYEEVKQRPLYIVAEQTR